MRWRKAAAQQDRARSSGSAPELRSRCPASEGSRRPRGHRDDRAGRHACRRSGGGGVSGCLPERCASRCEDDGCGSAGHADAPACQRSPALHRWVRFAAGDTGSFADARHGSQVHTLHTLKPSGKLQPHTFPMKLARTPPPSTSAAAGASAEFSAPSPSVGSKRPRSPGALADLSQAAMPNKRLRLSASDGSLSAGPEVKAPALQTLIGTERAADLDVRFGSLQPVRTKERSR